MEWARWIDPIEGPGVAATTTETGAEVAPPQVASQETTRLTEEVNDPVSIISLSQ